MPLPQSPPHSLLCPGSAGDGRNGAFQHTFSRPVSTHTSSSPATWSLYPWHHPGEASSETAASLLKGTRCGSLQLSIWMCPKPLRKEEGERFVMSNHHQPCTRCWLYAQKQRECTALFQIHICRWQRWIRNLVLFSLPLLFAYPTLENSQLLSSNHPVCEQAAGRSTATSGKGQRRLPNLPWDEMNTAHFLIYKYIEKGWKNTAENCHTTHSLLQSACYRQSLQHHSSPPGQRPLAPAFLEFSSK